MNFKANLIEDQRKRLGKKSIACEIINISELKNISENAMTFIQLLVKT